MRQYAVLRNVVRDVNFGVVVKSEGTIKFFGWSEKAVEWANWANANNADLNQLPPNISIGEFKGMSDEMMKNIILSSEEATAAGSSTIKTKTLSFNVGGERHQHSSKFPSFVDSPIASDWMAKKKSINFKALNFKKEIALSEISLGMRSHELAFNNETKQFVAKPNKITATYSRSKIQKKISRSAERKFGKQIVEYANKEISKNFVAPTIKRDSMGKFTKEILDVYTKAKLGRALGRAVGSAARRITPNKRKRGVASRFISGELDPMKRRDVDGDGMIFDGTWREMPDPKRFAKVPQNPSLARRGEVTTPTDRRPAKRTSRGDRLAELLTFQPDQRPDGRIGYDPESDIAAKKREAEISRLLAERLASFGEVPRRREGLGKGPPKREGLGEGPPKREGLVRLPPIEGPRRGEVTTPTDRRLARRASRGDRLAELLLQPDQRPTDGRIGYNPMLDTAARKRDAEIARLFAERLASFGEVPPKREGLGRLPPIEGLRRGEGLRSSRSTAEAQDDAGRYDDMPSIESAVTKLTAGERMSVDELDYLNEVVNKILNNPDTPENVRDAMLDLNNSISKRRKGGDDNRGLRSSGRPSVPKEELLDIIRGEIGDRGAVGLKPKPAKRPARDGESITPLQPYMGELSRRGLSRSEQRVDTPLSTRRSLATTQRAASPRGTTLRSSSSGGDGKTRTPAERTASRRTGAGPGGKAGHNRMKTTYGKTKKGDDGKVFDSLTPEQQAAIKKELTETVKPALDKKLKTFFSKYWASRTQRGSKKQSVVAVKRRAKGDARGRYEKVSEDAPLESDDIYEMLYRLDGQVSDGLVEKFEVSDKDSRELKLDENGNAKVSTTKNGYTNQQRTLDDTQTVLNMIEADDFSALEHLHPSTKKKIADVIKKNGGEVPKGWIDSESSVAGWAGGEGRTKAPDVIDLEKERGIGKKKKDKRPPLFQRLRRVDPERERRVELRAARRQGRVREGIALDPELELKRRKLRARAMKRTFMSRFRKNRDPEELSTDMKARKDEVSIVKTNTSNGTVEITDGFVDLLNALDQGLIGINEQKKGRKLTEQQIESEYQTLLRRLWENSGYSETPIQLKEDEVKSLVDAGWQPIIRGTGGEKINSETYVEQFITSEGRFIPGQGGSAYGIGEYFAYPGQWDSYGGGPNDRHTIVALIPPSADMMTRSEIQREHGNLQNITTRIGTAFKVFGGRDATRAMTAEEIVAEIDKAVPDLASDRSRTGQIVKQLRDRLEVVSKLPQNDEASRNDANDQKTKILNSLDYLERFSKQQAEMIAPLIGVDAIDTNEGDGMDSPVLLHNRTNVAAFQVPTTRDQAKAMVSDPNGQGRPKAWTKWKRTLADVKDRESAPTRRRRSRTGSAVKPQPAAPTPAAPTPAAPTPAAPTPSAPNSQGTKAPVDVSSWTSSRPQSTGSNPATLLTAPDGTQYYTKLPKGTPDDKDRMETESLASELYKLAGIQSADVQVGTRNGQPVTLSRMVQSRMPNSQADQDEALKGYVVDAWLANWDAPLNDNIKIDSNGNAVRLDVGGSLDFRAQGARKGQAWGNTVGEIDSMKKGGTYDYNKITDAAIKQQAKALGNVTDVDIRATVSRIVSDPTRAKALADTLIARRDDIVKRYGQ